MSAHKPSFHSQNKMLQTSYNWILGQEGECTVCLTNAQIQMIFSVVDYFGWKTRWSSPDTEIDQDTIDSLKDDLVRRLMAGCQGQEPQETRYTDDGVFQVKNPVTDEWEDKPDEDLRLSTPEPPRLVGAPGDEMRCAAADNIRDYYRQTRDELISLLAGAAIVTAIVSGLLGLLAVVLFSTGVGAALGVVIWSMAAAAFTLGHDGVEDQLTDAVMDQFKCLVYNRLNASGEITYENWQALIGDIDSEFDDFPQTFFHAWTAAIGYRGLIAAAAAGASGADDCACGEECGFLTNSSAGNWDRWELLEDELYDWSAEGIALAYNTDNATKIFANGYHTTPLQAVSAQTIFLEPCFVDTVEIFNLGTPTSNRMLIGKKVSGVWTTVLNEVGGSHSGGTPWVGEIGDVVEAVGFQYFDNFAEVTSITVS